MNLQWRIAWRLRLALVSPSACLALGLWLTLRETQTFILSRSYWGIVASSGIAINWHPVPLLRQKSSPLLHSSSTLRSFGQGMLFWPHAPSRRLSSEGGYCQVIASPCGGCPSPWRQLVSVSGGQRWLQCTLPLWSQSSAQYTTPLLCALPGLKGSRFWEFGC